MYRCILWTYYRSVVPHGAVKYVLYNLIGVNMGACNLGTSHEGKGISTHLRLDLVWAKQIKYQNFALLVLYVGNPPVTGWFPS